MIPATQAGDPKDADTGGRGGGGMGISVSSMARPPDDMKDPEDSLHGVVLEDSPEKLSQYLKAGGSSLDIDAKDEYGFTALQLAADRGYLEAVKILVLNGANIGVKDPDGHTALALARVGGHEDIIAFLEQDLSEAGEIGQGA